MVDLYKIIGESLNDSNSALVASTAVPMALYQPQEQPTQLYGLDNRLEGALEEQQRGETRREILHDVRKVAPRAFARLTQMAQKINSQTYQQSTYGGQ